MIPGLSVLINGELIAAVAQLVEQRIRNAWVGGSNPSSGTTSYRIDGYGRLKPRIYQTFWEMPVYYRL